MDTLIFILQIVLVPLMLAETCIAVSATRFANSVRGAAKHDSPDDAARTRSLTRLWALTSGTTLVLLVAGFFTDRPTYDIAPSLTLLLVAALTRHYRVAWAVAARLHPGLTPSPAEFQSLYGYRGR